MKSPKKHPTIALLSPGWPYEEMANGIVSYVSHMVDAIRTQGSRVIVLTRRESASRTEDFVHPLAPDPREARAISRFWDEMRSRLRLRPGRQKLRRRLRVSISQLVERYGVDLIEGEETWGNLGNLAHDSPIPVVVRLHGPWFLNGAALGVPQDGTYRFRVALEGKGIQAAHGVSAPARDMLERTREHYGLPLEHARVLPNPTVLAPGEHPWKLQGADPKTLLFVGRFDRHKGGDLAIRAFNLILDKMPDVRLLFVGPDRGLIDAQGRELSLEEFLPQAIPEPGRQERVEVLGFRNQREIGDLRRRAMLTMIASRYENFAYAGLETMAMGCPLVCARTGGMPEMFTHEESALFFEAGNAGDLARQCLRVLTSPDLAVALSEGALSRAERTYHPRVVGEAAMEYYREVIERFRRE